jgi:hypothetical protein
LQKRFLLITILTGILCTAALVGYLVPARSDAPPVRVLLDNKGGKIIFTHKVHADMAGRACADCHHTSGESSMPPACSKCHVKKFDETFAAAHQSSFADDQCASCHHPAAVMDKFSHDAHANDYAAGDCQSCHHDTSIEAKPQACANCHDKRDGIPSLKEANHTRCASCHEDLYAEGAKGCRSCHTRKPVADTPTDTRSCSDCHQEPTDQLIPTTMAAFHTQCMGCHEKSGSGPYGDDACYQCHMK